MIAEANIAAPVTALKKGLGRRRTKLEINFNPRLKTSNGDAGGTRVVIGRTGV
jgi:hypothetical protein